jgi:hypothetical protein
MRKGRNDEGDAEWYSQNNATTFFIFFLGFGQHKCTKLHKHLITFIV